MHLPNGVILLSDGENACLDLVLQGKVSKEIARELNLSPHTVDDRLRSACRKLGARNRFQAAQIYGDRKKEEMMETGSSTSRLRYEDSDILEDSLSSDEEPSAGEGDGSDDFDRKKLHRLVSLMESDESSARPNSSHPIAAFFWGINKLSAGQRLLFILLIALGFILAVGIVVNGMAGLSRMLEPPREAASSQAAEGVTHMLKERLAVANKVAADLAHVESALDQVIAVTGALMNTLPAAQAAAKLSPVVGDAAYAHLRGTIDALFAGRSQLVAFHHEMDRIKNHIGLRNFQVTATGDAVKILEPKGRNDDAVITAQESRAA